MSKVKKMKEPKAVRAWAIAYDNIIKGAWLGVNPTQSVCVLATFRYRNLATIVLNNAPDKDGHRVIPVLITPLKPTSRRSTKK